jgi:hypothetical protein
MATFQVKRASAALAVLAAAVMMGSSGALAGGDFPTVVTQVLMNQADGPVAKLEAGKKQELIACVNTVLADLPNGKKRFVVEGASYDEQQDRFGEEVMAKRAEWKQKIAKRCAHIVV